METAAALLIIIGIINGVKLAEAPDKRGFFYFLLAVGLGILFGATHLFGVATIEAGLTLALQSSGLYKVAQVV